MNHRKKPATGIIDKLSIALLGIFTALFPLLFLSSTTDSFTVPKQVLLILTVTFTIILFCIKSVMEGKVKLKTTPFDLPLVLFALFAFLSAIFSVNRFDSLTAFVPLFFSILLYFVIVNTTKTEKSLLFLISCLTSGAVLSGLITILSYLKIYLLPFVYTRNQFFNTYGSLLDEIMYLALILPLTGYFAYGMLTGINKRRKNMLEKNMLEKIQKEEETTTKGVSTAFTASFAILALTIGVIVFIFFTNQKPIILPFETGFQTAFAAISQDTGRIFKSFLIGTGYGTYLTDFTRFKQPTYNDNALLWQFTFFRSSSFILELLSTVGFLGTLAFIFLLYKILKEKNFFLPVLLGVIAAFILPFSFTMIVLFFILLAVFALIRAHDEPQKYTDIELYIVALKHGLFAAKPENQNPHLDTSEKQYSKVLPLVFSLVLLLLIGIPTYFSYRYMVADMTFQKSLIAASQNQAEPTYNLQRAAIATFPYRDVYYRGFAQTNIALANALATSQANSSASAEIQQNILILIQQAITSGRSATTVAPQTAFNWNSLSDVYRSLIGFGQNADKFAVLTGQQAEALDPNNPQQYIALGGIYYQLGQYDYAISEFSKAASLKKDFPNAFYNLGHALEAKGDLKDALEVYKTVRNLVKDNKENASKIDAEIKAVEEKIKQPNNQSRTNNQQPTEENQTDLEVDKPTTSLPERNPRVNIPGPTLTPIISPTKSPGKTTPTPLP
jgi:tetratricopeptide (TPR) repeat protein